MKKELCAIFITILAFMLFAPAAFAADARWRNVATITPPFPPEMAAMQVWLVVLKEQPKSNVRLFFMKRIGLEHILKFPAVLPPIMDKRKIFWYSQH